MSDAYTLPPPPDPVKAQQWAGQARSFLTLLGGILGTLGITLPAFTDAQLGAYVYSAMLLAGVGSYLAGAISDWLDKRKVRATLVASSNASAILGQPVAVTVTAAGLPNDVRKISATEVAAAPYASTVAEPSPAAIVP